MSAMKSDVLFVAGLASVECTPGVREDAPGSAAIRSGVTGDRNPTAGARHLAVFLALAGGSSGPAGAAKTRRRDQPADLSKAVSPLDVQGAARSPGEGPLRDDPLGAGGDLQIRVWRKQRLGVANVTVPIDTEAYDNLLRR